MSDIFAVSEIKRDPIVLKENVVYHPEAGDIVIPVSMTYADIARWLKSEGCTLVEIAEIFSEEE